jgi:2-iminobutanoate/2-iminopropanoate deaminase
MSDGRQQVTSPEAPPQSGGYSQGVRAGNLLFLSGQAPFTAGGELVSGSTTEQVRQALANLDAVARAGGASLAQAVRVGVYLRDLADFDEMDAAYRAFFAGTEVLPARTTIQSDLIGFDVEIDAVVLVG